MNPKVYPIASTTMLRIRVLRAVYRKIMKDHACDIVHPKHGERVIGRWHLCSMNDGIRDPVPLQRQLLGDRDGGAPVGVRAAGELHGVAGGGGVDGGLDIGR